jgi:hypothetical protein
VANSTLHNEREGRLARLETRPALVDSLQEPVP